MARWGLGYRVGDLGWLGWPNALACLILLACLIFFSFFYVIKLGSSVASMVMLML